MRRPASKESPRDLVSPDTLLKDVHDKSEEKEGWREKGGSFIVFRECCCFLLKAGIFAVGRKLNRNLEPRLRLMSATRRKEGRGRQLCRDVRQPRATNSSCKTKQAGWKLKGCQRGCFLARSQVIYQRSNYLELLFLYKSTLTSVRAGVCDGASRVTRTAGGEAKQRCPRSVGGGGLVRSRLISSHGLGSIMTPLPSFTLLKELIKGDPEVRAVSLLSHPSDTDARGRALASGCPVLGPYPATFDVWGSGILPRLISNELISPHNHDEETLSQAKFVRHNLERAKTEIWTSLKSEVSRADEIEAKRLWSSVGMSGRWKREIPENPPPPPPPTSGIFRHDSHVQNSGGNPTGNRNPVHLGGGVSSLNTTPPRPLNPVRSMLRQGRATSASRAVVIANKFRGIEREVRKGLYKLGAMAAPGAILPASPEALPESCQTRGPPRDVVVQRVMAEGMQLTSTTVAERLACSTPTKVNWVQSPAGSLLVRGFSRDFPIRSGAGMLGRRKREISEKIPSTSDTVRFDSPSVKNRESNQVRPLWDARTLNHYAKLGPYHSNLIRTVQRHDGKTARLARKSDDALGLRVGVARIAPSLLDLRSAERTSVGLSGLQFCRADVTATLLFIGCYSNFVVSGLSCRVRRGIVTPALHTSLIASIADKLWPDDVGPLPYARSCPMLGGKTPGLRRLYGGKTPSLWRLYGGKTPSLLRLYGARRRACGGWMAARHPAYGGCMAARRPAYGGCMVARHPAYCGCMVQDAGPAAAVWRQDTQPMAAVWWQDTQPIAAVWCKTPGLRRLDGGKTPSLWRLYGGKTPSIWRLYGGKTPGLLRLDGGKTPSLWRLYGGKTPSLWRLYGGKTPGLGLVGPFFSNGRTTGEFDRYQVARTHCASSSTTLYAVHDQVDWPMRMCRVPTQIFTFNTVMFMCVGTLKHTVYATKVRMLDAHERSDCDRLGKVSAESLVEARYERQGCTPVQCSARRGDERIGAHVSVAPSAPTLLGLRRAKSLQPGGHLNCRLPAGSFPAMRNTSSTASERKVAHSEGSHVADVISRLPRRWQRTTHASMLLSTLAHSAGGGPTIKEVDLVVLKNVKCSDPHCWILRAADCGCVMNGLGCIGPWKHPDVSLHSWVSGFATTIGRPRMSRISQTDGLFWRKGRGWLPNRTLSTFTHGVEIIGISAEGRRLSRCHD
ncbi:hypothetical protein PR048_024049 [Dryococelus australis]|uniref:Uncharacterized protein n=1 Tax=Dryococelus australis TaxID=614101 RepID=A0ABQ9GVS6_9NEOP|nr:hypothetical protein PR048_024049 [Dryococelus australis]